jgi:hypothetical protein
LCILAINEAGVPERPRSYLIRVIGLAGAVAVATCLAGACGGRLQPPAPKCQGAAPVTFTADDATYLAAELRACAFDISCTKTDWWWAYDRSQGQSARACLADWSLGGLDAVACAPNASTCDEWIACATHGHCASWCAVEGYGSDAPDFLMCDGDDVIVCGNGTTGYGTIWQDCAAQGMHCQVVGYGAACTDGNTCTRASNPHCDGNRVVGCDGSTRLEQSQDCATGGGQCVKVSLGTLGTTAGCTSSGSTPCDLETYVPTCQGTVATVCALGSVASVDCAAKAISGSCVPSNGEVQCVPEASECTANTPDTCDGVIFVTCGTDQKLGRIDCTTLGFRTCGDIGGRVGCIE